MLKTTLHKSVLLTCLVAVTFASCRKELDVEPVTEKVNFVPKPADLMLASTAPVSKLAGSVLALGINGHMGDAPYLATSPAKQIQMLKDRGMSWYRLNVQTKSDGSASSSDLLDALQAAATAGGVKILPMLYPRTMDYNDSQATSYQKGKLLGANFAAKYGSYFTYYNLGNDLELPLLLPQKTGQSQTHYYTDKFNVVAAYLKGMDEGIKSKDAGAKTMITAGWLHYGFLRMCEWYGVKFDVVAYNWYSDMENAAPKGPGIPDITLKLSSLFPTKPIWFTEFNYRYKATSTTNESDQEAFVTKFVAKCKANPQVKVAMVYELFDEPYKSTQEGAYGILKWKTQYTSSTDKVLSKTLLSNLIR
ncbi:glycosyl hydrolase [Mucilaginibacter psychrotolerans]|uniref:Asl1-like glycosyl hydrolase catalytic domain-containing protein n=1 Tax=Mucilaginibacter psychrotolerans TaxID=1524096 RepID=A0A4Y8SLA4_9SPHI|nr:glycosyl hydrolase [Mucilaginibacter psychrotolerans]TFF39819.1 hypothetical protein E2R66_05505 [Mucilaginibacter psychrotolerans]